MLDSGASSNFIAESLVQELGLKLQSSLPYRVRLADGKLLETIGQV